MKPEPVIVRPDDSVIGVKSEPTPEPVTVRPDDSTKEQ